MTPSAQESLAPTGEPGGDLQLLRGLIPFARPHLWLFVGALVTMPLAGLAALLQPLMVKGAIEAALVSRSGAALMSIVLAFGAAIFVEFLGKFAQTYLMQLAGQRTTADLRRAVFEHVQRLRVSYFDREPVGRVVTRMTNDIDAITEMFASGAVTAISDVMILLGILAFMLYLDVELTVIALLAVPPLVLAVNLFRRWAREAFRSIRVHVAQLNAYLNEQVQGIAVVQAYGREAECAEEYRTINHDHRDANYRNIRVDALLYSVVESVATACLAVVLYYAATAAGVMEGSAALAAYVGTVVAFYDYIQRFFVPIRDLATKYTVIQSALASAERIFGLLNHVEPDCPEVPSADTAVEATQHAIEFRSVTFSYKPGQPVLHDIGLSVRRGEQVGVVGATGSGKTTLMALLLRLYELDQGQVRVYGQDIRALSREAHRARFATVPQDVFLFTGSVLENIALHAHPERERVREVLVRVGAWDWVEARGGLDARVEERGANWSAGERQLLAFARALYRDAPILVLDEATANVDSETEARLQRAVGEVITGRTALVIAHRLSTIRALDRILVFHHGRIAEQGSHDELMAQDGIYARLHALQVASEGVAAQ